jgi:hypothetical protein
MAAHSVLRATIRLTLASTSDWPDATLDKWIAEATRFYSAQFPRQQRHTLALTTGTQAYALPGGHDTPEILTVEYPTGETPQSFLRLRREDSQAFANADPVYALRPIADTTAANSDTVAMLIVFAETVTTGEYAAIDYNTLHRIASADTDIVTIPAQHWEALQAFCLFRAYVELEADEAITVDSSNISIVLAQLGQATRSAWFRYKNVIDRLTMLELGRSIAATWQYNPSWP